MISIAIKLITPNVVKLTVVNLKLSIVIQRAIILSAIMLSVLIFNTVNVIVVVPEKVK
jgi:hypothetical protein